MRPSPAEIEEFFGLLLADDVLAIAQAVDRMIERGLSAESVVLDVLVATARRMGQRWCEDGSDFVAVTVAVGRLQQELRRLSPVLCADAGPQPGAMRVLLAQHGNEAHMFGLSVAAEFFRRDGWDVVGGVAGAVTDPVQRVRSEWFEVAGLSIGSPSRLPWLRDCVAAMRQQSRNPHLVVVVGGPVFSNQPDLYLQVGADLCADAVAAPGLAGKMVAERQRDAQRGTRPDAPH